MFNKLKGAACGSFGKMKSSVIVLSVSGMTLAGQAQAAVDPAFATNVDAIVADGISYAGIAGVACLTLMAVVLGWDIGINLAKKFVRKGSR